MKQTRHLPALAMALAMVVALLAAAIAMPARALAATATVVGPSGNPISLEDGYTDFDGNVVYPYSYVAPVSGQQLVGCWGIGWQGEELDDADTPYTVTIDLGTGAAGRIVRLYWSYSEDFDDLTTGDSWVATYWFYQHESLIVPADGKISFTYIIHSKPRTYGDGWLDSAIEELFPGIPYQFTEDINSDLVGHSLRAINTYGEVPSCCAVVLSAAGDDDLSEAMPSATAPSTTLTVRSSAGTSGSLATIDDDNSISETASNYKPAAGEELIGSWKLEGNLTNYRLDFFVGNGRAGKQATVYVEHSDGTTETKTAIVDAAGHATFAMDRMSTFTLTVEDSRVFDDVDPAAYYGGAVRWAKENHVVNGIGGTASFAPERHISRAEVVCMLFNLATEQGRINADDAQDAGSFSDVATAAYYARAVAWAKNAGVVNGYNDGTFKPEREVTREEFAAMLANYAASVDGKDVSAAASALDSVSDGGQVSSWARGVVSWAVANKIMGNGGSVMPTASITRADVASMIYNYAS